MALSSDFDDLVAGGIACVGVAADVAALRDQALTVREDVNATRVRLSAQRAQIKQLRAEIAELRALLASEPANPAPARKTRRRNTWAVLPYAVILLISAALQLH